MAEMPIGQAATARDDGLDRLRIGIDGYNLAMPNGTGVASYGFVLARTLQQRGHRIDGLFGIDAGADRALREVMFFDRLGRPAPERSLAQRRRDRRQLIRQAIIPWRWARARDVPLTGAVERAPLADRLPAFDAIATRARLFDLAHRHFHYYGRLLPVRMADPPPIMHWTYPVPLRLVGARNIYTLHDLVPLRFPYTTLDNKSGYRALIARCVRDADRLCTVSEASRADILVEFPDAADRLTNTYQASALPPGAAKVDPAEDAAVIESAFGLKARGFFLYFGAIEPKKNIGRLLEAYLAADVASPLVMVGGRGWRNEGELALLQADPSEDGPRGPLDRRIVRLDHLPRALLLRLVRSARAVLFPSIYEGFGLPILEAMQLGTPVLTSTISSPPEVAGDAALLVDPYDTGAIAAGIRRLESDAALRQALSTAGPLRARSFSTDAYADRLEQLYAEVLAR